MMYVILVLAFFVRIINLNQSLWLDEAAQALESARPLSQQLNIAGDFWPPLYHLLLHFWMYLGTGEIILRSLSVLISLGSLWVSFKFTRLFLPKKTSLLLLLLLAMSPFHIWYSQEIRPYMLSVILGMTATYFLIRGSFTKYAVAGLFLAYTTYLSPFLFLGHIIYTAVFDKKNLQKHFFSLLLIFVCFLPWLPQLQKQLQIGMSLTRTLPGWSEAVSVPLQKVLPLTFSKFIFGRISFSDKFMYGAFVLLFVCIYGYFYASAFQKNWKRTHKISCLLLVPIITTFLFSFFIPVIAPQRLLFLLPLFYLVIFLGVDYKNKLHLTLLCAFYAASFYSLWLYNSDVQFQRENWREAVKYVETKAQAGDIVVFVFPDAFAPWLWYSRSLVPTLAVAPGFTVKREELNGYHRILETRNRVFLFHYLTDLTDPKQQMDENLISLGFIEASKHDFSGVGFVSVYEKTVAAI